MKNLLRIVTLILVTLPFIQGPTPTVSAATATTALEVAVAQDAGLDVISVVNAIRAQEPTIYANFNRRDRRWSTASDEETARFFADGAYHIQVSEQSATYGEWSLAGLVVADFLLEVDVTITAGIAALLFRHIDDDNFYVTGIGADGGYWLNRMQEGAVARLIEWTQSDAIKVGQESSNRLGVLARGSHLVFMVNNQIVATVVDPAFSAGDIALAAARGSQIAFDELKVWDLATLSLPVSPAPTDRPSREIWGSRPSQGAHQATLTPASELVTATELAVVPAVEVLPAFRLQIEVSMATDRAEPFREVQFAVGYRRTSGPGGYDGFFWFHLQESDYKDERAIFEVGTQAASYLSREWREWPREEVLHAKELDLALVKTQPFLLTPLLNRPTWFSRLGAETIGSVESWHYVVDSPQALDVLLEELGWQDLLSLLGDDARVRSLQGDLWIAKEGRYVVKSSLQVELEAKSEGSEQGHLVWTAQVSPLDADLAMQMPNFNQPPGLQLDALVGNNGRQPLSTSSTVEDQVAAIAQDTAGDDTPAKVFTTTLVEMVESGGRAVFQIVPPCQFTSALGGSVSSISQFRPGGQFSGGTDPLNPEVVEALVELMLTNLYFRVVDGRIYADTSQVPHLLQTAVSVADDYVSIRYNYQQGNQTLLNFAGRIEGDQVIVDYDYFWQVGAVVGGVGYGGGQWQQASFRCPLAWLSPGDWPPLAPTNLQAVEMANRGIRLSWDASSGAEEYLIYRSLGYFSKEDELIATVSVPYYEDLSPEVMAERNFAFYTVFARNRTGKQSQGASVAPNLNSRFMRDLYAPLYQQR
jgi:hypothetical protein